MAYTVNINGTPYTVDAAAGTPLLWVLRDLVGLTGTKYGCGVEICRACTVLMDGEPVRACKLELSEASKHKISTVEGLAGTVIGAALQAAFVAEQVPQCGWCQSGMLMAAAGLLKANPKPSDAAIEGAIGNICMCGTYQRAKKAVKKAAGL